VVVVGLDLLEAHQQLVGALSHALIFEELNLVDDGEGGDGVDLVREREVEGLHEVPLDDEGVDNLGVVAFMVEDVHAELEAGLVVEILGDALDDVPEDFCLLPALEDLLLEDPPGLALGFAADEDENTAELEAFGEDVVLEELVELGGVAFAEEELEDEGLDGGLYGDLVLEEGAHELEEDGDEEAVVDPCVGSLVGELLEDLVDLVLEDDALAREHAIGGSALCEQRVKARGVERGVRLQAAQSLLLLHQVLHRVQLLLFQRALLLALLPQRLPLDPRLLVHLV